MVVRYGKEEGEIVKKPILLAQGKEVRGVLMGEDDYDVYKLVVGPVNDDLEEV